MTQCEKRGAGKERPWGEILKEEQGDLPDLILYYGVERKKKKRGGEGKRIGYDVEILEKKIETRLD